ncbi:hypothetical protein [Aliikangiella sp. G2MR2-5]|uniref:hypothetical protein n=1 Tax=Aliikangiella sp. G2MR2-5 TaxID=2788943 RepID=UPI0018AA04C1|nr:hypothetical protein [Aliikangiella sp. G2MR2-5]
MKRLVQQFILINLILAGVLTACSQDAVKKVYTKSDVKLNKFSWSGNVPEKKKVVVVNEYGNITTRSSKQGNIMLSGVIQLVGPDAPEPEVKTFEQSGVLHIEVLYKSDTQDAHGNRIARMDMGVYVPENVSLEIKTSFGDIKAKKHQSNIVASSDSGKIKLASRGTISAQTNSGAISAHVLKWEGERFGPRNKKKQYQLNSQSGEIDIYYDADTLIDIKASSGVQIKSDSPSVKKLIEASSTPVLEITQQESTRLLTAHSGQNTVTIHVKESASSSVSTPSSFEGDVRDLPKTEEWKPGDPIIEMQDGRSDDENSSTDSEQENTKKRGISRKKKDD